MKMFVIKENVDDDDKDIPNPPFCQSRAFRSSASVGDLGKFVSMVMQGILMLERLESERDTFGG